MTESPAKLAPATREDFAILRLMRNLLGHSVWQLFLAVLNGLPSNTYLLEPLSI